MTANRVVADEWTPAVWSHGALMAMQATLDPARIMDLADDWVRSLDSASRVLEELARRVARLIDESWRGQGADAALLAVLEYVATALDGLRRARSVADGLADLAGAAAELKAGLTPPEPDDSQREAHRRLVEALEQVRTLYSVPAVAAGNAMPDIPAPPVPVPNAALSRWTPPDVAPASAMTTPAAPLVSSPPVPLGYAGEDPTPGRVENVRPAAAFAEFDQPRTPLPVNDRAAAMSGLPAASSSPSMSSLSAGPAAAAAVRPSAPAFPFLGAPYPGYAGRDSAAEHRTPGYLISPDNAHELIGPLRKVAPPVIGE